MLKELAEVVAKPITTIMDKSIEEGNVPDSWKKAHIALIIKKEKKTYQETKRQSVSRV